MKTLSKIVAGIGKRMIPLTLTIAGLAGLAGCVTTLYNPDNPSSYPPAVVKSDSVSPATPKPKQYENMIDFGNGFYAASDFAADAMNSATCARLGEVILIKTDKGYKSKPTEKYLSTGEKEWNSEFNHSCIFADSTMNHVIDNQEAKDMLDFEYQKQEAERNKIIWEK
jgi:hypothetical protein